LQDYLFRFGYCTPNQWAANDAHGWDDESSAAFYVQADAAEDALAWGREVADLFVMEQFQRAGMGQAPSWKNADSANWIEESPDRHFTREQPEALPRVEFLKLPLFDNW